MPAPTSAADGPAGRVDELFGALAHPTRRRIVRMLAESDPPVDVKVVAAAVSDEHDASVGESTVLADLLHRHVPKLVDAGLVAHDRDSGHLEPTERTGRAKRLVDVAALQG